MMESDKAEKFAQEWISAWNRHDLNAILSHYAEDVEFFSPFISLLKFNDSGRIRGKEELSRYFRIGLDAYPELRFELHKCLTGVSTVVLYYTSVKERIAAEVFELNAEGLAVRVYCNYAD